MNVTPLPGARRFETFVRWTTYATVAAPVVCVLGAALAAPSTVVASPGTMALALAFALAVSAGNVVVVRWSLDVVAGRAGRLHVGVLVAHVVVIAAFVPVFLVLPVAGSSVTLGAGVASVAASFVPALRVRWTVLLTAVALVLTIVLVGGANPTALVAGCVVISSVLWGCWSSAWMLRVLRELEAAHEDRAALALAQERLRISRDLHDVFGRTLAAIAVKTSLASELVGRGRNERAGAELDGIRRIAEQAGTEVRRVVRGELHPTWDDELSGAQSLLASAGIHCTVAGDPVPERCAEALAWVVREGVTNLLRHSTATQVTLATAHTDGEVVITLANDGAHDRAGGTNGTAGAGAGTGLDSLSERIGALGGRVTARRDGAWFLLDAAVPSVAVSPKEPV